MDQFDPAKAAAEETAGERETRSAGNFAHTESQLPAHKGPSVTGTILNNAMSMLGKHNPAAREVDPREECVWLLDNIAYRPRHPYDHEPQPFQANYVAAYFQRNAGKDLSKEVASIADRIGRVHSGMDDAETRRRIAHRLEPFADTIAPGLQVTIGFPSGVEVTLGPGDRSAVSSNLIVAPNSSELHDRQQLVIRTDPLELLPHGVMTTYVADEEGWVVVSDIDDSIKITMTPSSVGILKSTFVDEPTPIPGMPELYAEIDSLLQPTWFYLSASPYNLYPFLREFLHAVYPHGQIMLREASWMDIGGFLEALTQGTECYKRDRMKSIYGWLPRRKVLCVGDSTQSDPEAYGDICRLYPGWIHKVFIRKVVDVAEMKDTKKNEPVRFQKAFHGVDPSIWQVFENPSDLADAVRALKAEK